MRVAHTPRAISESLELTVSGAMALRVEPVTFETVPEEVSSKLSRSCVLRKCKSPAERVLANRLCVRSKPVASGNDILRLGATQWNSHNFMNQARSYRHPRKDTSRCAFNPRMLKEKRSFCNESKNVVGMVITAQIRQQRIVIRHIFWAETWNQCKF